MIIGQKVDEVRDRLLSFFLFGEEIKEEKPIVQPNIYPVVN